MAAGNTFEAIATQTLGSATNTVTFTSIPSTYTDLYIVVNYLASGGGVYANVRLNSDSGSNYSRTALNGDGSSAQSFRQSNESFLYITGSIFASSGNWATINSNFMNYSNTTTFKTSITRNGAADNNVNAMVHLWRSTSAINSITFTTNANNFGVGSTFSLYGIKSA